MTLSHQEKALPVLFCVSSPTDMHLVFRGLSAPSSCACITADNKHWEVRIERQLWKVATKCMSNIHFLVIQCFHFSESPPPHQDICNYMFPLRFSHGHQSSLSHYLNSASHSTVYRSLKFFFCLLVLSCIYFVHNYFSLLQ